MSIAERNLIIEKLVFQDSTQAADLADPDMTQSCLIAYLAYMIGLGWHIEITAVRSDHSNDAALGEFCHQYGYCVDCWPLASATPGDYLDASSLRFQQFLADAAASPWCWQIGLAGEADTEANMKACGQKGFVDDGADHIHLGSYWPDAEHNGLSA
jgi:hypothetical protein